MTDRAPVPPLVHELTVAAGPEHAFTTWVERAALWWPAGHTVSGAPEAVVFEPRYCALLAGTAAGTDRDTDHGTTEAR